MTMLVSIDNGGTLTDACVIYGTRVFHAKTLTTPHDLTTCFVEVLKEASRKIYGEPRLAALLEEVDYIRYSTTQGTNAVVQRLGPRLGLVVRKGADVSVLIRNGDEKELFSVIVGDRLGEIDVNLDGDAFEANITAVINHLMSQGANRIVVSLGGEALIDDESRVKRVTLLRYPRHLLGAVPLLFSHQLSDDHDDARRTWSSLLNAFLHPAMERFLYNAENVLRDYRAKNPLLIFCNDGTSSRVAKTIALKTWGSGPRGGMEGAKAVAQHYSRKAIVSMDIGGTTTDIGVVDHASLREQRWGKLESIAISFPLSEVESLGAGGSSVFRVVTGEIVVGPESVGSAPGPACFGRGGKKATITDAYLLMGVLDPESYFGGNLRLDAERAKTAVRENVAGPLGVGVEEAVLMMERAYEEKIAKAMMPHINNPAGTTLLAFGGAGPITACGVAQHLGVSEIIVPRLAAVFSAFGIGFSDIAHSYDAALGEITEAGLRKTLYGLVAKAERDMFAEGFVLSECALERAINFTHNGVEATQPLDGDGNLPEEIKAAGNPRVRVRATKPIPHFSLKPVDSAATIPATSGRTRAALIAKCASDKGGGRRVELPLFRLEELTSGMYADGPAIIEEEYFTCRVPEGWRFTINDNQDIVLQNMGSAKK